ncbi:hypothetical protein AB0M20_15880 [Actinoplanes sp. NPDC051633]|uniref:hypothetical protein n=1 Tax=Actinoplanes sp. NPDC051633 TaxID=3155670 RepID=UPI00343A90A5
MGGTLDVHDDLVAGLAVPRSVPGERFDEVISRYAADHPVRAWWLASGEKPEVRA